MFKRKKKAVADVRSGRMILAIDCILNQNARDPGAATAPAINAELVGLCLKHRIGIFQMPCPEMRVLGPERKRAPGQSIRDAMDTPQAHADCRKLSIEVVDQAVQYLDQGYEIIAVVGGNPQSPGCAVHTEGPLPGHHGLSPDSGIFMQELASELSRRNIRIPFLAMRDADPGQFETDLRAFEAEAISR